MVRRRMYPSGARRVVVRALCLGLLVTFLPIPVLTWITTSVVDRSPLQFADAQVAPPDGSASGASSPDAIQPPGTNSADRRVATDSTTDAFTLIGVAGVDAVSS